MASISRYDPFGEVVNDFFRGFLVRPVGSDVAESAEPTRRARIEVTEQKDGYKVNAELPGVKKEDIKVEVDGDQVSISAETRTEKEAKDGERVLHSERYYGKVARSFRLGADIDQEKVNAKYENGVLELTLPKKAASLSKQVTIQ